MPDLIVKLYGLPDERPRFAQLKKEGVVIRRAMACDKHQVVKWVQETFGKLWASECDVAFTNHPASCFLATKSRKPVGFACYDSSMKNFFGPIGVVEDFRGKGIGTALLLQCLQAMAANGYAYAIIGDVELTKFYQKTVHAHVIPDSSPGVYFDRLKKEKVSSSPETDHPPT
ncbi:MAG: GNAT family N-acetyltransferase [Desulfobulbaceae bacterium]|nr:GNAT family N-acetyltransferase [Desulfobulbaceae bacterium]